MSRRNSVQQSSDSLLPTAEVDQDLSAVGGDAPGHNGSPLGAVAPQARRSRLRKVRVIDPGQVPSAKGLIVLPQLVGDLRHPVREIRSSPVASPKAVLDVAGRQPSGAYISTTRRSKTAELPSRYSINLDR
jgi:hypothetical protein